MAGIYIIDKDKDFLATLNSALRKKGFDVFTFFDWNAANNALKSFKPEVILLKVFLPGTDGVDICQKLKASPYSKKIPIILYSSFTKIAQSAINDYGADDFIVKPFKTDELVKKINSVLSKKQDQ